MQYEPVKQRLGKLFGRYLFTRRVFYRLLDILLLRTWHVHRELRRYGCANRGKALRVLDAGSGLGQYSWYLARRFPSWDITATDINEEAISDSQDFFRRSGVTNVSFRTGDLAEFVEPGTYDLVLSVDVMEHIEEDTRVFQNLCRSMKPGGMLLISTPSDQGGSDVHGTGEQSFIEEHVRDGYNRDEIEKKLKDAGFHYVESKYTYGKPGSVAWRISMKYPITWLGRFRGALLILPFYYLITMPLVLALNLWDVKARHDKGTGLLVKAFKAEDSDASR